MKSHNLYAVFITESLLVTDTKMDPRVLSKPLRITYYRVVH